MTVQAAPSSSVEKELEYRKKLTSITNQINSAESIPQILVTLKDRILDLLDSERLTISPLDTKNQELFSLFKVGRTSAEIRVPKSFSSIAGFTALSPGRRSTFATPTTPPSSTAFHPNLSSTCAGTSSPASARSPGPGRPDHVREVPARRAAADQQPAQPVFSPRTRMPPRSSRSILGIAFYNQHRAARRTSRPSSERSSTRASSPRRTSSKAVEHRARQPVDVAKVLHRGHAHPEGGDARRARGCSTSCAVLGARRCSDHPAGPSRARLCRLPEEERLRAGRATDGHGLVVAVDDPLRPHAGSTRSRP